jgi:hypothetical protein
MLDVIIENRLSLLSIICSIILLWFIIHCVKKDRIKEAYALIWIFMGIAFLVISIWPSLMGVIAGLFGIYYAPALMIIILTVMIIFILIQFSIVISRQSERIKVLTQELALLKADLEDNKVETKNLASKNI